MGATPMRGARLIPGLWCVCLLAAAALPVPQALADAPKLQVFASDHYHIHTNLTKAETVPYGRHLDAVFKEYRRRFSGFIGREAGPMPVYLFRTQAEYLDFLGSLGIKARHSGGMFFVTHRARGLATYVDEQRTSETYAVLQHEGFHQFAWTHLGPELPTWVNEGLAQYFEDAPLVNGRLIVGTTDGGRLARVRAALNTGQALPLGTLFNMSERQWGHALHHDAGHSGLVYSQAWSVVYFLIHGEDGRYRAAFNRYLREINAGRPEAVAYRAAFGTSDPSVMQRRWAAYVRGMETPALSAAAERLDFLATALSYYDRQGWPMPDDLDEFEQQLTAVKFSVRRIEQGVETVQQSDDRALYTFVRPGGDPRRFELLAPSRSDLPPRIAAPGLVPEPRVEWSRADDGTLRHTLVYR